MFSYNEHEGRQVVEPILYDPMSRKSVYDLKRITMSTHIPSQQLHSATPGSLLKVWTGKLDLLSQANKAKAVSLSQQQLMNVELFSTQDIKSY